MKLSELPTYRRLLTAILLIIAATQFCCADESRQLADSLRETIRRKEYFVQLKELRIDSLRDRIPHAAANPDTLYALYTDLYNEYRKFNIDSAITYARRATILARQHRKPEWETTARLNISMLYSMCGRFREAEHTLDSIHIEDLPPHQHRLFFEAHTWFWDYYSISVRHDDQPAQAYRDSLFSYLPPDAYSIRITEANSLEFTDSARTEQIYKELFDITTPGTPEHALLTNDYAFTQLRWGNREKARQYYMRSAISDLRCAIRETVAQQNLALMFFEDNMLQDAYIYTQSTIDDIAASGISFRASDVYRFYSIVNQAFHEQEQKAKSQLTTFLIILGTAMLLLLILAIYIYIQMRRIMRIRKALAQTNSELQHLNGKLNEKNEQLRENNNIKEHYITQFFDVCFTYIHQMEQNHNILHKLAAGKSYADLIKRLKSVEFINEALSELYTRFDTVFLKLYPTFIEDFNSLLRPDEQVKPKPGALLNKELRIYALLRLGISDSGKIAGFLRCSTSTVYNYRTRMRNRAAVNRDDFENLIMKIAPAHEL